MGKGQIYFGAFIGAVSVFGLNALTGYSPFMKHTIPLNKKVQKGYIAPSRLEIECKNLDGRDGKETIMKVGKKSYLLREVNGKPVLSEYNVRPAKIIIK